MGACFFVPLMQKSRVFEGVGNGPTVFRHCPLIELYLGATKGARALIDRWRDARITFIYLWLSSVAI